VPGGYSVSAFEHLAGVAKKWKVNRILVEKNFGHGAFLHSWLPTLRRVYDSVMGGGCAIEEVWESGQKELRIIDTLEPVISRGSLIFNDDIARDEPASLSAHPADQRTSYSLFHQIRHITRDKGSLQHDDRLDSLAAAVRYWTTQLGIDQDKQIQAQREREFLEWQKNPLGRNLPANGPGRKGSLFNKYRR